MGGLFDDDAQQHFLEETNGEPIAERQVRQLDVRLPKPGEPQVDSAVSDQSGVSVVSADVPAEADVDPGQDFMKAAGRELQQDVVIRLSESVVRALVSARNERQVSTTEVVLDAIDEVWPTLEQVVPPAATRTSPLPARTRHRRAGGSQGQRVHLRFTASERAVLEDIVDRTTAGSLTDLIDRVLRLTLDQTISKRA